MSLTLTDRSLLNLNNVLWTNVVKLLLSFSRCYDNWHAFNLITALWPTDSTYANTVNKIIQNWMKLCVNVKEKLTKFDHFIDDNENEIILISAEWIHSVLKLETALWESRLLELVILIINLKLWSNEKLINFQPISKLNLIKTKRWDSVTMKRNMTQNQLNVTMFGIFLIKIRSTTAFYLFWIKNANCKRISLAY